FARSALVFATSVPVTSCHGPSALIRSIAFTVLVESHALYVPGSPAAFAALLQSASAPVRPPMLPVVSVDERNAFNGPFGPVSASPASVGDGEGGGPASVAGDGPSFEDSSSSARLRSGTPT